MSSEDSAWRPTADPGVEAWPSTTFGSANEPIPVWCELLNEGARERAVAAPALPDVHGVAGKFRRAVFRIFEELEATLLRTIEPEDDSFAELRRLVLMSEIHSALEVVERQRHRLLDCFPSSF